MRMIRFGPTFKKSLLTRKETVTRCPLIELPTRLSLYRVLIRITKHKFNFTVAKLRFANTSANSKKL